MRMDSMRAKTGSGVKLTQFQFVAGEVGSEGGISSASGRGSDPRLLRVEFREFILIDRRRSEIESNRPIAIMIQIIEHTDRR
jgi:hypothetical protein